MGVSIIIPVYNTEQYLEECLNSVVSQSKPFDRIIVVDDGSTDKSLNICKKYANRYSNITLLTQENKGQGNARNCALDMVQDKYVMFLDSDDFVKPNMVENIHFHMEEQCLDILYFDSDIKVDMDKGVSNNFYDRIGKMPEQVMSGKSYFTIAYPKLYIVQPCMVAFRTELLKKNAIQFPETSAYEDEVFSFKAMLQAERVQYLPQRFYVRRYREGSTMTEEITVFKWNTFCRCVRECWDFIIQHKYEWNADELESMLIYLIGTYCEIRKKGMVLDNHFDRLKQEFMEVQKNFCDCWRQLEVLQATRSFRFSKRVYSFLTELDKSREELLITFFCKNERDLKEITREEYIHSLQKVLNELPFWEKELKIGIYGTGNHTRKLLKWYQYLCGEITCELYYIDTYRATNERSFMGRPIINVKDTADYVDRVVISSSDYEKEIYQTIIRLYGNSVPIYYFYKEEREDIFIKYEPCLSDFNLEELHKYE